VIGPAVKKKKKSFSNKKINCCKFKFADTTEKMLRFQHISYLFSLALVPVFIVLFVWLLYWRRNKLKKLGDAELVAGQLRGMIQGRNTLKFILLVIAFSLIGIGWANLQSGDKTEKVQRKGVDVMIALDVSKSMLARDVQPDRLTKAKQLIMRMTDKMQNDRVGLIVFAGRAYLQVPLTIDYSALKMMLSNVSPSLIPTQGTVIGDAIDMAMQSFSQKEKKYKSLVIISDGEDHDEQALAKAKEAAEQGVTIHTVGIGSPQGTTLYDPDTKSVKLDENGAPVVSKLNEDELRSLANAGHGTYTLLRNTDDAAEKLVDAMANMEQKSLGSVVFTDFTSYFQYFLLAGFILLFIEWLLPGAGLKMKTETT
jgi:Ca-activated chloride channel family protein